MTPNIRTFYKSPTEILDYTVDFSAWLDQDDTILTFSNRITSYYVPTEDEEELTPAEIEEDEIINNFINILISGGTVNTKYKIKCQITTLKGKTKEVCFYLVIREN